MKSTTLEDYIRKLIELPKVKQIGKEAFIQSPPIQSLVEVFGLEKIKTMIDKNWSS